MICRQCVKWGYAEASVTFATLADMEAHAMEKHPTRLLAQYQGVMRMLNSKLDGRIDMRGVLAETLVADLEEFPDRNFKAFFPQT